MRGNCESVMPVMIALGKGDGRAEGNSLKIFGAVDLNHGSVSVIEACVCPLSLVSKRERALIQQSVATRD